MRELTPGELRYINESTDGWRMYIYSKKQEMTPEIQERMSELSTAYKEAFYAFYEDALQKGEVYDSDAVLKDFNEIYEKEHPEFFDIDALLEGGPSCK